MSLLLGSAVANSCAEPARALLNVTKCKEVYIPALPWTPKEVVVLGAPNLEMRHLLGSVCYCFSQRRCLFRMPLGSRQELELLGR